MVSRLTLRNGGAQGRDLRIWFGTNGFMYAGANRECRIAVASGLAT